MKNFAIRGDIIWAADFDNFAAFENRWLVCEDGRIRGIFRELPDDFANFPREDFGGCLISPGFVDIHLHAPQYAMRGIKTDLPLVEWLEKYTFPEESKFVSLDYARFVYAKFADELLHSATTRAVIFATIHAESTFVLHDLLEKTGMKCFVGKVNSDRNSPSSLCETMENSISETRRWLGLCKKYENAKPILTPRFVPTCSDALLQSLGEIQKAAGIPVQSHLDENLAEIDWVSRLRPDAKNYADAYLRHGLFGGEKCPTIMAHCVHPCDDEIALLRERAVFVAHCPLSNLNLASGVASVRKMHENGVKIGLGSDIAGGETLNMFRVAAGAVQSSKARKSLLAETNAELTACNAFFMATKGGGEFFGKVGGFEQGCEADAVVLDDSGIACGTLPLEERIERLLYLGDDRCVKAKYVGGRKVF